MSKPQISKDEMADIHVRIPSTYEQLVQGRISRRQFLRTTTLLGMSFGVASLASACATGPTVGTSAQPEEAAEEAAPAVAESSEAVGGVKRGGILRVGTQVKAVDHPARFSWIFDANQCRHTFEYLTETGSDNITRPYLLESWTPNDDLTVWDLKLREGIMWFDGEADVEELIAEHVKWNMEQWFDPDVKSSILGQWTGFLTADGVEVVDDYTLRLNMESPLLAVPEQLFHYPAQILHPTFDGDVTSGKNLSTGPMTIKEFSVGERVILEKREGYWQMGADDNPLPYLDGMEFVDLGDDQTAHVAALLSGQIDNIYQPTADTFLALRENEDVTVEGVPTAATRVLRFRVDESPWDDNNVRSAIKMCQDRGQILDQAYFGEGISGYDTHLAPVHPAWAPMDVPAYDPEGAKALLAESGYDEENPLEVAISVGTGWPDIVAYGEALQESAKAAGIEITLDTMPNSAYWDLWTETPVGITTWAHRPLGVMILPLAYIADDEGNPVPWNETRWIDEEFSEVLKQAQGTFDIEERRALYEQLQTIQLERGSIGVAYFVNQWATFNPAFQGMEAHPTNYNLHREVWYDPDMETLA